MREAKTRAVPREQIPTKCRGHTCSAACDGVSGRALSAQGLRGGKNRTWRGPGTRVQGTIQKRICWSSGSELGVAEHVLEGGLLVTWPGAVGPTEDLGFPPEFNGHGLDTSETAAEGSLRRVKGNRMKF